MPDWLDPQRWIAQIDLVQVVHLAIALSLLEMAVRLLHGQKHGSTQASWGQALHVGAGLCLMFALREALTASRPAYLLIWLTAAGAAHLADTLWRRRAAASVSAVDPVKPS